MRPTIIIFGAAIRPDGSPSSAMRDRVAAALRLGRTLDRPRYMPTGGVGRHGPAEAAVMRGMLEAAGVPAPDIVEEPTGTNTIGSVRACARLLRAEAGPVHAGPVYAASSAYHLPRCVLLLRLAGLRARACPPLRKPASGNPAKRWYWRLREMAAVPVDCGLMLWSRLRHRP